MKKNIRLIIWIGFIGSVLLLMMVKAWQLGWLQPKTPLNFAGQPAVLVFVKYHGVCDCEQYVNDNARAQVDSWQSDEFDGINLFQVDIDQRPDIAKQYKAIRAPSMVLLNQDGEIVWRQDGVLNDELPMDLPSLQVQIADLLTFKERHSP